MRAATGTVASVLKVSSLPVTRNLSRFQTLSLIVAILMTLASLAGIFSRSAIYPTEELRRAFVPNDVTNLFIGLPVLLCSIRFTQRGRLIGLLALPGALFYVVYNYIAYAFAIPISVLSLLYSALVVLSAFTMASVVASIDAKTVQRRLVGAVRARFSAGVLIGFGSLFLLRAVGVVFNSHTTTEFAVAVADLLTTPIWIIGGVMLWRRSAVGYTVGLSLLFQASLLFVSLVAVLLLQSILTAAPLAVADIVVIFVMGLVCFVPFVLFVRGVTRAQGGKNEDRS